MLLTALHRYPVKGLQGEGLQRMDVERCGPWGDRRWMVVEPNGSFLTQRKLPRMARLSAAVQPDGSLRLSCGTAAIEVALPVAAERLEVAVWRSRLEAALAGERADAWLSEQLGWRCRLVHLDNPSARPVERTTGVEQDDVVSFADGYPLLLTSSASLDALNMALKAPVPMDRFRPNLVVDGGIPWQEDGWRRLRIGDMLFRAPKACTRCVVITLDQRTGQAPQPGEPLRTLGRLNRTEAGIVFGRNLIPEAPGRIAVGDPVEILG
ncbi:MOSC domain-containing protein [Lichenicoccus roseus]|uniref:MOSC domain-containing protein n=1 Tax=Lichenicoccus roseus TaxID=2683649 RepID=A0A5R9JA95_9PROT|nr:MOSC N-terminal beta barrel domain-containing protein [Lichenicoccus roseus]TLU73919.1 MOSC domain-containing protein [Lichenicoccus roseus]